jgi:hypothetical protein
MPEDLQEPRAARRKARRAAPQYKKARKHVPAAGIALQAVLMSWSIHKHNPLPEVDESPALRWLWECWVVAAD